jgi:serine phosphatase RsbU (regulator of sigma subunit)
MAEGEYPKTAEKTLFLASAPHLPTVSRGGHFLSYSWDGEVRRQRIGPSGVTVGRQVGCDIVFPVPQVSREHCRFRLEDDGGVTLLDLFSTNGTFVGDLRIDGPTRLANGDQVAIGDFLLRYEWRDAHEVEEETRLTRELRQGAEYVRAILPPPISEGPVRAEWWYAPSSELGGDAFGYQFLDETTLAGFLIDVSGHGVGAALLAANVANVLRRRAMVGVDFRDPAQVAAGLNAMFPMEEHGGLMLTLWCFTYDVEARTLRFCSAGHHPALLVAPGGPEPAPLWRRGPAIGMLPAPHWEVGALQVEPGSRLYVFSDGAFEILDDTGRQRDIEHLRRIIGDGARTGDWQARWLYDAVRATARPGPLEDDFSVLVLSFQ